MDITRKARAQIKVSMTDTGLACEESAVKYYASIIAKKSLSKQELEKQ